MEITPQRNTPSLYSTKLAVSSKAYTLARMDYVTPEFSIIFTVIHCYTAEDSMMIRKFASAFTGGLIVAFLGASLFSISLPFESYTSLRLDMIAMAIFWLAALVFTLTSSNACVSWKWQMTLSAILSLAIAVYAFLYPEMIRAIDGINYYQAIPAEVYTYAGIFGGMVFLYLAMSITNERRNFFTILVGCENGVN